MELIVSYLGYLNMVNCLEVEVKVNTSSSVEMIKSCGDWGSGGHGVCLPETEMLQLQLQVDVFSLSSCLLPPSISVPFSASR